MPVVPPPAVLWAVGGLLNLRRYRRDRFALESAHGPDVGKQ